MLHRPVLIIETLNLLRLRPDCICLDGTGGTGGCSREIVNRIPGGRLITLDIDPQVQKIIAERLEGCDQSTIIQDGFENIENILYRIGVKQLDAAVLDLGMSSYALEEPGRGFSHRFEGPLDMRFDPHRGDPTAAEVIKTLSTDELADIISRYGEQPGAKRLAAAMKENYPQTTRELADIVSRRVPPGKREKSLARVFQALRIFVNRELERLEKFLQAAPRCLASGGRLAIISYHSLEDRMVKEFFQRESKDCICPPGLPVCACNHKATFKIVTKKPVRPTESEIASNPRARSARLRVGERI